MYAGRMRPMTDNLQGSILMTASMAAFTLNDTCMKLLGGDLPFFQTLFLRSVGVTVLLIAAALVTGAFRLPDDPRDRRLILIRSGAEIVAALAFISALFHMPIANITAIIQALPLTVTLGAALVLKEPVGWRRFTAIEIGLMGVLLIVRPGGEGFTGWSAMALLAVAGVTVRDLAARRLSKDVPTMTVALAAAIGVGLTAGAGAAVTEWRPLTGTDWLRLAGAVIFVFGGYVFSVMAMRVGEIGAVAPFRYTSLLVALVVGLTVFGEWPDGLTLIGSAIVVATGLFTLVREREKGIEPAPPGLRMR